MLGEKMAGTGSATLREFEEQVTFLRDQGLVDFKAMVSPSEDAPTFDLFWTFANAVRVYREGGMAADLII